MLSRTFLSIVVFFFLLLKNKFPFHVFRMVGRLHLCCCHCWGIWIFSWFKSEPQFYVKCRPLVTHVLWRWFFLCPSHNCEQNSITIKPSLLFRFTRKYFVFQVHFFSESIVYQGCQIKVGNTFQTSLKLRNSKTNLCNAMLELHKPLLSFASWHLVRLSQEEEFQQEEYWNARERRSVCSLLLFFIFHLFLILFVETKVSLHYQKKLVSVASVYWSLQCFQSCHNTLATPAQGSTISLPRDVSPYV